MCGIAGYSLSGASRVDRTLSAQSLLAGIAERGADAVGTPTAQRRPRSGPQAALRRQRAPRPDHRAAAGVEALVHVRDYTKGHPSIAANNHPVRHGPVVGIHNGIIANDDELFDATGHRRATRDDRRLRGDLRPCRARARQPARRSSSSSARWRPPGSTSAAPASSSSPAASAARSGSAGAPRDLLRLHPRSRSRSSSATLGVRSRSARSPRARWSRSPTAAWPGPSVSAPTAPSSRSRSRPSAPDEGALCLARLAALVQLPSRHPTVPSARTATPCSRRRSERGTGTSPTLPGASRTSGRPATRSGGVVGLARLGPVGELRQALELPRQGRPCSTARSRRSSPTGTSKPASRRAVVSEPNVCQ